MRIIGATGVGVSAKENVPKPLLERIGLPYNIFKWQDIIEKDSNKLIKTHTTYGTRSAKYLRTKLYDYAFDAISYRDHKEKIQKRLDTLIKNINDPEIVLIGHSWGSIIFYDYLKENPDSVIIIDKLITFGCPIPFAKNGKHKNINGVKWINYWEDSDPFAHKMFRSMVIDREFHNRNWLKGWNPLSHLSYFKSRKLAKLIKKDIVES